MSLLELLRRDTQLARLQRTPVQLLRVAQDRFDAALGHFPANPLDDLHRR